MKKIMKACLLLVSFFPFIVDSTVFFPYTTGKVIFFRSILFLINILFLSFYIYKKDFRSEIFLKINKIIKNPLFLSILGFVFISTISMIFAVNKYTAFLGELERGEGLVGILFLFLFFVYIIFFFEKKDYLLFFKLSLFVSFVIIGREFFQFYLGVARPGSFLENPIFLAGYLLFSIFSAIFVFSESKNNFWKYFPVCIFVLSILGVFITGTRGTILGLVTGFFSVFIYFLFKKESKEIFVFKKNSLRRISIIMLCVSVLFSLFFVITKKNDIWQKIPGFSRMVYVGSGDSSTNSRLINIKLSIDAINPVNNGIGKFLIGWGPDNFILAYQKYLNLNMLKYDAGWFDRAHNRLLDVLVMNGVFGLMSYLLIFIFLFSFLFKNKEISIQNIGFMIFGISLLIHLLFVFEQMATSIPFFIVTACILNSSIGNFELKNENFSKIKSALYYIVFLLIIIILSFVFVRNDLIGYLQMKKFSHLIKGGDVVTLMKKNSFVFEPNTTAQSNIRKNLLIIVGDNHDLKNKTMIDLSNFAIGRGEEYMKINPYDVRFLSALANAYNDKGLDFESIEHIKIAEKYLREILILAPNRPDIIFSLAFNLFNQRNYNESFASFEEVFNNSPYLVLDMKEDVRQKIQSIYIIFLQHFYATKDKDSFIKVADRLKEIKYKDADTLYEIINFIDKTNIWPNVDFN